MKDKLQQEKIKLRTQKERPSFPNKMKQQQSD